MITWTPTPNNPDELIGQPENYKIRVARSCNSTTGLPDPRGRIIFCRVFCGKNIIRDDVASIVKAKAIAERHAEENRL